MPCVFGIIVNIVYLLWFSFEMRQSLLKWRDCRCSDGLCGGRTRWGTLTRQMKVGLTSLIFSVKEQGQVDGFWRATNTKAQVASPTLSLTDTLPMEPELKSRSTTYSLALMLRAIYLLNLVKNDAIFSIWFDRNDLFFSLSRLPKE